MSSTLEIRPEWKSPSEARTWTIETTRYRTLFRRRVYYRAEAWGYAADSEWCAAVGVSGFAAGSVTAPTADEAVELMRDYICRQRKAYQDYMDSRDIRRFAADEVCL